MYGLVVLSPLVLGTENTVKVPKLDLKSFAAKKDVNYDGKDGSDLPKFTKEK